MRNWVLVLLLVLALWGLIGESEEAKIPLPEGAVARLGLGKIGSGDRALAFSPDGKYLAVATSLGVELRDAKTLKLVRFFQGHTEPVRSVAFSPNRKIIASGSRNKTTLIRGLEKVFQHHKRYSCLIETRELQGDKKWEKGSI